MKIVAFSTDMRHAIITKITKIPHECGYKKYQIPIVIKKYDQVPKTTKKPKVPKSTKMLQKEEKKEQIAMKSKDLQNVDLNVDFILIVRPL